MNQYVALVDFSIRGKNIHQGMILDSTNIGLTQADFNMLLRLGRVSAYKDSTTTIRPHTPAKTTLGTRYAMARNEDFYHPANALEEFKKELATKFVAKVRKPKKDSGNIVIIPKKSEKPKASVAEAEAVETKETKNEAKPDVKAEEPKVEAIKAETPAKVEAEIVAETKAEEPKAAEVKAEEVVHKQETSSKRRRRKIKMAE